ncbi:DMT family transporter [Streptomyces albus]|uniref:DMT family transporter n=1 Tax=Streptomyces albus TaxID=1888 RepID=UPI000AC939A3|nr:DMT family transporter [Streptomyces albus]
MLPPARSGLWWGLLGVTAFSFTVPFTRVAVAGDGMSALFTGCGRAVIAALLAAVALAVTRQRLPRGLQWGRLAVVAAGVVVGFPVLTSYALTTASASHSAVVIALLPAATAVLAVLRGHERPPKPFWAMAQHPPTGSAAEWAAFAYLGVVSMFLGFFAWYRGLAIGPMAQVSQIQLVQPVLTICWAALLLHEHLTWPTVLGGLVVVGCAGTAVRTRLGRAAPAGGDARTGVEPRAGSGAEAVAEGSIRAGTEAE